VLTWGSYTVSCTIPHHMVTGDFVGIITRPAHMEISSAKAPRSGGQEERNRTLITSSV